MIVLISVPPKMTEQMSDAEGIEDHNVTLRCKAKGKPDPKYEFFKVCISILSLVNPY